MSWLTPATGLILAAALIPPLLLLYFLKLRRRTHAIASTLLWQKSIEDLRANAPFQRLRYNLLLLLQLIALLLLVLAVMQPQILGAKPKGGRTVLLIDNSASMTAVDDGAEESRLEEAKRRAKDRIETLYGGGLFSSGAGETMVVAFSDRAEVLARFSRSKQELLAAVDRVQLTHGRTEIGEAFKLARAYTTNVDPESDRPVGDPPTLEVFTDGRIQDLDAQVLRGEEMIYHRLGGDGTDNVAISALALERPYDRPSAVEVFVAMVNFGAETAICDVQLAVDAVARAVEEISVPGATIDQSTGQVVPGRRDLVFTPFELPRGAVIEVANLRADMLASDNVAQIVAPAPKQLAVAVVGARGFLIRTVLEGMPLRRLELLSAAQYEARAEQGTLAEYDVIVFDGYAPPEGAMPPGRYLSLGKTPPVEGLNEFGEAAEQVVLNAKDEHPVLRFVQLDDLFISRCTLLQPDDTVEVLVEGSEGPIVLAVSRGPLQVVHVAFDPLESSWPLLRSWVTFLFNAVEFLGHVGEGLTTRGFEPGEAITARLPANATDIKLFTPDGDTLTLDPPDPTMLSWGPARVSGLFVIDYEVPEEEERQQRAIAVNQLSAREAIVSSPADLEIGQQTVSATAHEAVSYTPLWPFAIGFCLAVLLLEWWVYHKKLFV